MTTANSFIIGVDIGGTFTGVFFLNQTTGTGEIAKVPSTPQNPADGFIAGIKTRIQNFGDCATIVHGTTVATNALLQRTGAKTGIITTRGFRDVLEMRRRDRPETWGLWGSFKPIISRDLRIEVDERTLADGTIRTPLDPDQVRTATLQLRDAGVDAIAIFFINAYANHSNEIAALNAVRGVWPDARVNISSAILPEIREFERASTTSLNAYLQPVVGEYLEQIETRLQADAFRGDVLIVQSNGGVMSAETARDTPIRTALSGPAAGVIAGSHIAASAGYANAITCDMGGTSFDVSVVVDGENTMSAQTSVDYGLVIRTPMIEITTIGAGGGSIAWVDRGGILQVGPQSAGSHPGPVCYGQGNDRPTVTDANLVLGRINAERPIGGKLDNLDGQAAAESIERHVGTPLELGAMEAAEAIIRVANSRMAGAIRLVTVERGHDPRQFIAMPFGGGGALHTGALISEVGLAKALIPRYPGVTSALGCAIADMRHDFVQTINALLDELDAESLDQAMTSAARQGLALLDGTGISLDGADVIFEVDMSYLGQTHTVAVPLDLHLTKDGTGVTAAAIQSAFEHRYTQVYGRLLDGIRLRVLNLRVSVIGRRAKFDLTLLAPDDGASVERAARGERPIWWSGAPHSAQVFARLDLPIGARIAGPAVLEQPDATTFIDPDMSAEVDGFGNLIISRMPGDD